MNPRGANVRIVSDQQNEQLAAAIREYQRAPDAGPHAQLLARRVGAVLGADVVLLARRSSAWDLVAQTPSRHRFGAEEVRTLVDRLEPGVAATHRLDTAEWTVMLCAHKDVAAALAIEGDWTLSTTPFQGIAESVAAALHAPAAPPIEAGRSIARLQYRMLRRLPHVRGMAAVSEVILSHAARAVEARIGALAVSRADGYATIVATYGYPRALVEHIRIEPGAGVIGRVMVTRRPILVAGPDPLRPRRLRYRTNSFAAVPVLAGRDVLGAICVTDRTGDDPFSPADVSTLRTFAASAALALERERALDSAEAHAHAAAVDPVSGVFNRRYLQVRLGEELQRSRRHEIPLALLLIDIDDFKIVNDSYGHLAGDMVLRDVAEILRRSVRVFDVCARFGGEEFVIIMPGSTADNAMRIGDRIRERIEAYRPADRLLASLRITVSLGLAVSEAGTTVSQLLDRADRALYAAKRAGKNRIRADEGETRTYEPGTAGD